MTAAHDRIAQLEADIAAVWERKYELDAVEAKLRAELEIVRETTRNLLDALLAPSGRDVRKAWDAACLQNGRYGATMMRSAFEMYLDDLAGVKP